MVCWPDSRRAICCQGFGHGSEILAIQVIYIGNRNKPKINKTLFVFPAKIVAMDYKGVMPGASARCTNCLPSTNSKRYLHISNPIGPTRKQKHTRSYQFCFLKECSFNFSCITDFVSCCSLFFCLSYLNKMFIGLL